MSTTLTSPTPQSKKMAGSVSTGPLRKKAASPLTPAKRSSFNLPVPTDIADSIVEDDGFDVRHVKLDFELYREGRQWTPSVKEQNVILNLFPTSYRMSIRPPFLIVFCTKLPPKPWPISVAGVPLFLTDNNELPINYGLSSHGPKASVKSSISLWKTPDLGAFQEVFSVLNDLGANIRRLQWIGTGFLALATKEPYGDWRSRLPFLINNIFIGYVFGEKDLEEKAVRRILPQGRTRDDTTYNDLRPGIMITSKASNPRPPLPPRPDTMTTSGICLNSPEGEKVITVSSHGFPGGVGDIVFHPDRSGRTIAVVSKVIGETDIALATLEDVNYSRETFSNAEKPAVSFEQLLPVVETQVGSLIYMDTPVNGFCEGIITAVDVFQISNFPDEHAPKYATDYVVGTFAYYGNDGSKMLNGCCGGLVWDDNNDVVGQFRFQVDDSTGLCYSPSLDILVKLGYTISESVAHNPSQGSQ
ncbi:hypothetical protein MMC12_005137 [Toensbergia leucococca]|nr:hypothetical protein [Toensbergia leucococca]